MSSSTFGTCHVSSGASVTVAEGEIAADSTSAAGAGTTVAMVFNTNASKMAANASSSSDGLATDSTLLAKSSAISGGSRSADSASISARSGLEYVTVADGMTRMLDEITCMATPCIITLVVTLPCPAGRATLATTRA